MSEDDLQAAVSAILKRIEKLTQVTKANDNEPSDGFEDYQLVTICAMIFWNARENNVGVELVRALLYDHLSINDLDQLEPARYDDAFRFLADLKIGFNA